MQKLIGKSRVNKKGPQANMRQAALPQFEKQKVHMQVSLSLLLHTGNIDKVNLQLELRSDPFESTTLKQTHHI
jgi:hypothetical protein